MPTSHRHLKAVPVEAVADPNGDALDRLLATDAQAEVREVVRSLPEPAREVLCARFGLGPFDTHSLRQLAERFDVSLRTAWLAERNARELFAERWRARHESSRAA